MGILGPEIEEVQPPEPESGSVQTASVGESVGRLATAIGAEQAEEFFREREARREFNYYRAVRRWGYPGFTRPQ